MNKKWPALILLPQNVKRQSARLIELVRVHSLEFVVTTVVSFLVYLYTLAPTVAGGDSGELISAALTLGVAHPPGYPTYTMLGFLFTWLPFGSNIAWKVNFMSAVFGAAAAGCLAQAAMLVCRNRIVSVVAGLVFAFSPIVWRYSVVAEVFALNHFFLALLLLLSLKYENARKSSTYLWAVLVIGLGLSHHHTFVFFALPVFLRMSYLAFFTERVATNRMRLVLKVFAVGLLGLSPYLYLPWASSRNPLVSWGDLTTINGFMVHFLRQEYGTLQLRSTAQGEHSSVFSNLLQFVGQASFTTGGVGLLFSLWGAWRTRMAGWPWLVGVVSYILVFAKLANVDPSEPIQAVILERFWQLPLLVLCFWAAVGAADFLKGGAKLVKESVFTHSLFIQRAVKSFPQMVLGGLALALVALWSKTGSDQLKYQNDVFKRFGKTVLESLPPNAILMSSGDHITNSLIYLQLAEKVRPDVQIVDHMLLTHLWAKRWFSRHLPNVVLPGEHLGANTETGSYSLKDFFDANISKAPIFVVNQIRVPDVTYKESYRLWPLALVEYVLPSAQVLEPKEWAKANREILKRFQLSTLDAYSEATWEGAIRRRLLIQQRDYITAMMRSCSQELAKCVDPLLLADAESIFAALKKYQVPMSLENAKAEVMVLAVKETLSSQVDIKDKQRNEEKRWKRKIN